MKLQALFQMLHLSWVKKQKKAVRRKEILKIKNFDMETDRIINSSGKKASRKIIYVKYILYACSAVHSLVGAMNAVGFLRGIDYSEYLSRRDVAAETIEIYIFGLYKPNSCLGSCIISYAYAAIYLYVVRLVVKDSIFGYLLAVYVILDNLYVVVFYRDFVSARIPLAILVLLWVVYCNRNAGGFVVKDTYCR